MEKAGCQVWPRLIQAATCSAAGGYARREGVCAPLCFPFGTTFCFRRIVAIDSV
jgi:hypothetical protein